MGQEPFLDDVNGVHTGQHGQRGTGASTIQSDHKCVGWSFSRVQRQNGADRFKVVAPCADERTLQRWNHSALWFSEASGLSMSPSGGPRGGDASTLHVCESTHLKADARPTMRRAHDSHPPTHTHSQAVSHTPGLSCQRGGWPHPWWTAAIPASTSTGKLLGIAQSEHCRHHSALNSLHV
jgi:hypothetical protein